MKAHQQARFVWQSPLSQQPPQNDMMCTAATRVSLPISMRLLSACPTCLLFWRRAVDLRGFSFVFSLLVLFSAALWSSTLCPEKDICRLKHAYRMHQCRHAYSEWYTTHVQDTFRDINTHILCLLWAVEINDLNLSSWMCHVWCQGWNQWEHYRNCAPKQRGGSVSFCQKPEAVQTHGGRQRLKILSLSLLLCNQTERKPESLTHHFEPLLPHQRLVSARHLL